MRSKAPLAMMEQIVMLAVFALAAALCLQAFVKSDQMSKDSQARDRAMTVCQSAAEAVRHSGGDLEKAAELLGVSYEYAFDSYDQSLALGYDKDWNFFSEGPYLGKDVTGLVTIRPIDSGVDGLGKARIEAITGGDGTTESIFALEVCWQEEVGERG